MPKFARPSYIIFLLYDISTASVVVNETEMNMVI
jgi:hypothetical protein